MRIPFLHPLSAADRGRIVAAIHAAERGTSGEIRVHVQPRCGDDPVRDATRVFERLGMTRTAARNGVLIFLAVRDRRFAVIGDTAIHAALGDDFWRKTADAMTPHFARGDLAAGLEAGVEAIGHALRHHFSHQRNDTNELPDTISEG
jgi:uncharacterized membrane protein